MFHDEPPKLSWKRARNELEESKKLEIAVLRSLSSTYDYIITAQLEIQLAVLACAQSNQRGWRGYELRWIKG